MYPQAMEDSGLLMELFRKVQEKGIFDCVEFYFHGTLEEEMQIGKELKRLGLSAVFLAGYPMKQEKADISAKSESKRNEGVQICRKLYESACRMGAEKMLILSGPAWEVKEEQQIIAQTKKSLEEITAGMPMDGPQVTLEYFNDSGEPWLAVGPISMTKQIFTDLSLPLTGITFDTSHTAQMKEDIIESFKTLKPWIHHLHFANSVSGDETSPLYGDKHPLFGIDGGDISLENIKEIYKKLEKDGLLEGIDICSFEVISRGNEDEYFEETCREAAFVWCD